MIRFELALALLLVGAFIRATLAVLARAKVRSLGLEDEPAPEAAEVIEAR